MRMNHRRRLALVATIAVLPLLGVSAGAVGVGDTAPAFEL